VEFQAIIAFVELMLVENCESSKVFWHVFGHCGVRGECACTIGLPGEQFCCRCIAPSMRGLPNITAEIDAECFSVASGLQVCFGATGGVITANVFLQRGAEISDWYLGSCGTSLLKMLIHCTVL